ncbi:MAG: hypothetical protein ACFFB2_00250 [Promethearchaeota archaeon]
MSYMNSIPPKRRESRSILQRAHIIFEIINQEDNIFPKSRLKAANIHSQTIDNWLDLIIFIQSQPRIRVRKVGSLTSEKGLRSGKRFNTFVERIETKYSQMTMKRFLDGSLPIDVRLQSLKDYVQSVLRQELLITSEDTSDTDFSQTGLLSLYDEIGTITKELQAFTIEFFNQLKPEIEKIMELYPQSPEAGHLLYCQIISQKLPTMKIIARGLRDHTSLGQISPRLLREALPQEFSARSLSLEEEESFLVGYLIAILSLVYCIVQRLEGWQFIGTPLQKTNERLRKVKKLSMLPPILKMVEAIISTHKNVSQ